jgi:biotin carboxylase
MNGVSMNPEKTLLIIGHKAQAVRQAKEFGLNVILFQHKKKIDAEQAELADVTVLVDYRDWTVTRRLAEAAYEIWPFSAALSLTEPGLEVAGRINDLFQLGGTGYQPAHLMRDKWAMRRHLAAHGAMTIGAAPVSDKKSVRSFAEEYGYPFIVKPTDLSGGFGVVRVNGPADVDQAWDRIQHLRTTGLTGGLADLFDVSDFLMEEYVKGPEYSVEGFSFAGRHVVLGVTEKLTDELHFAELGHTLPARISAEVEAEIVAAVTEYLDVIGLTDGPSHTEVKIGDRGPIVIESHNRFGGGRIKDLVEAVYGIDLIAYSVGWPFRLIEELTDRPEPRCGACVRAVYGGAGRVESISGIEELSARPEVVAAEQSAKVGDVMRPLQDNWGRFGLVAVAGPDSDAAVRRCEELIASVRITMSDA